MGTVAAALGGAGVVGASGIASSAMSNNANKDIAQMNNAFNEKMLQKQMDYNTQMYERQLGDTWAFYNDQKQYNSPEAQRKRLEAAGLNAGLLMSGGSTLGTVTSSPTTPAAHGINPPTATPYSADYSGISQGLGQAVDIFDRMRNSASQRQQMDAATRNMHIEGQYKAMEIVANLAKVKAETKSIDVKREIDEQVKKFLPQMQDADLAWKYGMIENMKVQTNIAATEYAMRSQELAMYPLKLKLDLGSAAANLALLRAKEKLTNKQFEHEVKKVAETIARTHNLDSQTAETKARTGLIKSETTGQDLTNKFNQDTYHNHVMLFEQELWHAINNSGSDNFLQYFQNGRDLRTFTPGTGKFPLRPIR